jgi:hypothetical protein
VYEGIPTIENTTWIPKNAIISGKVVGTHTLSGHTCMHFTAYALVSATIFSTKLTGKNL